MKYEKPVTEVINFGKKAALMTTSGQNKRDIESGMFPFSYASYDGVPTSHFSCSDFGGYNELNPPCQGFR